MTADSDVVKALDSPLHPNEVLAAVEPLQVDDVVLGYLGRGLLDQVVASDPIDEVLLWRATADHERPSPNVDEVVLCHQHEKGKLITILLEHHLIQIGLYFVVC